MVDFKKFNDYLEKAVNFKRTDSALDELIDLYKRGEESEFFYNDPDIENIYKKQGKEYVLSYSDFVFISKKIIRKFEECEDKDESIKFVKNILSANDLSYQIYEHDELMHIRKLSKNNEDINEINKSIDVIQQMPRNKINFNNHISKYLIKKGYIEEYFLFCNEDDESKIKNIILSIDIILNNISCLNN